MIYISVRISHFVMTTKSLNNVLTISKRIDKKENYFIQDYNLCYSHSVVVFCGKLTIPDFQTALHIQLNVPESSQESGKELNDISTSYFTTKMQNKLNRFIASLYYYFKHLGALEFFTV